MLTQFKCVKDTESVFEKIVSMLEDLAHDMQIIKIYQAVLPELHTEDEIVDVFISVIDWGVFSIHFFRNSSFRKIMSLFALS